MAAWVEGLIRKIMPGILGGYTVFQTGEEGALGLIPITEPLKRMLRLP